MTMLNLISRHFATAASAFALSFVLISGTVSMPSPAQASGAYMGVVA